MTNRNRFLTLFVLAALVLLGSLMAAKTAVAHANIARAEPAPDAVLSAPPTDITIWFTEPLEAEFSEILVYAADRTRVDNGDSQLLEDNPMGLTVTLIQDPPLSDGIYTVAWKSVSTVDGHIVRSSYIFSIGQPIEGSPLPAAESEPSPSPLEPVIRWIVLFSIAGIFGGLAFDLFVLRPSLRKFKTEIPEIHHQTLSGRILDQIWVWVVIFFLASIGQLVLQTSRVSGQSFSDLFGSPIVSLLTNTYWGNLWIWRAGLILVLVALLPLSPRLNRGRVWGQSWERPREILALLCAAAIMLTLSLVSHAFATVEIQITAVISDFIHLVAAGAWAGGLFHFAWNSYYMLKKLPESSRRSFFAALVPRFSALAIFSVASLFLTGIVSSYAQVTVLSALDTDYGRTLLVKMALIVPLLALGGVNLFYISRRLAAEPQASVQLGRTVWTESILMVLVLLAVGVLVTLEPARQVASRQLADEEPVDTRMRLENTAERLTAAILIDTAEIGDKVITVELTDANGQPIENASDVILTIEYPAEDLQPFIGRPQQTGIGIFEFADVPFSLTGRWLANLVVVRSTAFDAHLDYEFEIGGDSATTNSSAIPDSAAITPSPTIAAWLLVMVFFGLFLTGILIWRHLKSASI